MEQLIAVVALFLGVPLLIIGGVWSVVRARSVDTRWMLAMLLLFPATLPVFALIHWKKARGPLLVTGIGLILTLITVFYIPEP